MQRPCWTWRGSQTHSQWQTGLWGAAAGPGGPLPRTEREGRMEGGKDGRRDGGRGKGSERGRERGRTHGRSMGCKAPSMEDNTCIVLPGSYTPWLRQHCTQACPAIKQSVL